MKKTPKSLADNMRSDGRFDTSTGFVHHLLNQKKKLAFDQNQTPENHKKWKTQVKRKLKQLMSFPVVEDQPEPIMLGYEQRDGYQVQTWESYPEPHCVVTFLMLVPDGLSRQQKAPAVMCFPGSQQPKEAICNEPWSSDWVNRFGEHNFMAWHYVKKGFVVLAFDNPGTASMHDPLYQHWYRNSLQLIWLGRSYEGMSVFQKYSVLQWLKRMPFVDRKRIAACGHSLGAKPALILGLLDRDVSAVIWNDMVSNWAYRDYVTNLQPVAPWHYVPGFSCWFDYVDLMAALAPTPFLVTEGGRLDDLKSIEKAYEMTGAINNIDVSFMANFQDPKNRFDGDVPLGINAEDYGKYANYDTDHYFKDDVAVPWLCELFTP